MNNRSMNQQGNQSKTPTNNTSHCTLNQTHQSYQKTNSFLIGSPWGRVSTPGRLIGYSFDLSVTRSNGPPCKIIETLSQLASDEDGAFAARMPSISCVTYLGLDGQL